LGFAFTFLNRMRPNSLGFFFHRTNMAAEGLKRCLRH